MKTKCLRKLAVSVGLACLAPWLALCQSIYEPYTFTTIAGRPGVTGSGDGTNSAARFNWPCAMTEDSAGNLYVADTINNTIRRMTLVGTNWVVTTLAGKAGLTGSADGTNSAARFNGPVGVAVDSAGNIYVVDGMNDVIRKVTPMGANWVVTTLAGRPGSPGSQDGTNSAARFYFSVYDGGGLTVDSATNLFVADMGNNTIRKMTPMGTNWVVTTLAGKAATPGSADGTNSDARFGGPCGVAVNGTGSLFVGETWNCAIRKVTPVGTNWLVTTLAGLGGLDSNGPLHPGSADGTNTVARFNRLNAVTLDSAGNLYVVDSLNDAIRKVTPVGTNWVVTTLAGMAGSAGRADGVGSAARFYLGYFSTYYYFGGGVAVDNAGTLYVADCFNNTIRKGYRPLAITASGAGLGFTQSRLDLAMTGPAGQAVVVEASPDFENWVPFWTNTFMVGPLQFCDTNCASSPQRFYRAHRQ